MTTCICSRLVQAPALFFTVLSSKAIPLHESFDCDEKQPVVEILAARLVYLSLFTSYGAIERMGLIL